MGALMISLDVNHPDIIEFVDIKANTTEITNANISVRVNNEFMEAVLRDNDYILHWPCNLKEEKVSDIVRRELKQQWPIEYNKLYYIESENLYIKKIKAKDLFYKLAKNNWNYAEPGILYWDAIKQWNMMEKVEGFEYAGVNPCKRNNVHGI